MIILEHMHVPRRSCCGSRERSFLKLPHLRYHFSRTAEISGNFRKFPDLGILAEKSPGNSFFPEISEVLSVLLEISGNFWKFPDLGILAEKSAGNTFFRKFLRSCPSFWKFLEISGNFQTL